MGNKSNTLEKNAVVNKQNARGRKKKGKNQFTRPMEIPGGTSFLAKGMPLGGERGWEKGKEKDEGGKRSRTDLGP